MRKAFLSGSLVPTPVGLTVNVTPSQLRDLSLPRQIRKATEQSGFPCNRLTIEITESGLVDNFERALKITSELKAMGCALANATVRSRKTVARIMLPPFSDKYIEIACNPSMTVGAR